MTTKKVNKKVGKTAKKTQPKQIPVVAVPTTKQCPKCKKSLSLSSFPHDARRKDGLYIYCRDCESKRQYEKHTRLLIKTAETEGYIVLKVNHAAPVLSIDVLKIDSNPNNGRTIETELVVVQ